ncbi:MAG: hypothetical protein WAU01_09115, partial [Saprospiraceae bacterium]
MFKSKNIFLFLLLLFSSYIYAQNDSLTASIITEPAEIGIDEKINQAFTPIATAIENTVLYAIPFGGTDIPIIVIILSLGGLFFSIYFGFPNIRKFGLAIRVVQ